MSYEVEAKFPLTDEAALKTRLGALGGASLRHEQHQDEYFAHPARNFAETDEAFRLRTVNDSHRLTYKGPKIGSRTKTRREIEVAVGDGETQREQLSELLQALGFRSVAVVRKQREQGELFFETHKVHYCLDEVADVGRFVELELLAGEAELPSAEDRLLACAAALGLEKQERRSYLEMLIAASDASQGSAS